jgi:hypothetical protein
MLESDHLLITTVTGGPVVLVDLILGWLIYICHIRLFVTTVRL